MGAEYIIGERGLRSLNVRLDSASTKVHAWLSGAQSTESIERGIERYDMSFFSVVFLLGFAIEMSVVTLTSSYFYSSPMLQQWSRTVTGWLRDVPDWVWYVLAVPAAIVSGILIFAIAFVLGRWLIVGFFKSLFWLLGKLVSVFYSAVTRTPNIIGAIGFIFSAVGALMSLI